MNGKHDAEEANKDIALFHQNRKLIIFQFTVINIKRFQSITVYQINSKKKILVEDILFIEGK